MNWIDYVLVGAVVASAVVGVFRGLLREIISLVSWILAVTLAWGLAPRLEPMLGGLLADPSVRPWAARAIIFVAIVLLGAGVGAIVTHFVRLSVFSGVDRLAGLAFGLLRGVVIIGLLVILAQTLKLQDERWYRDSMFVPYADQVAGLLRSMVGERKILGSMDSV